MSQRVPKKQFGPSPIFKRRRTFGFADVSISTNVTLSSLSVTETGTVYAVKLSTYAFGIGGVAGDVQELQLMIMVKSAAGAAIVDLTDSTQHDAVNGFLVGTFPCGEVSTSDMPVWHLTEKFRFRRKVDEGDFLELIGRNNGASNGTNRAVRCRFALDWVIRVR